MRTFLFFFSSRRRHTRFKCDWSSDVCSSDLVDRKAHRDPLTGVGNLLAWDEAVALADAQHAEPVSVIIADLDGLKRANDERGHDVGDALIRAAAETIRGQVRDSDLVARLGGDEFGVLLSGASPE